MELRLLAEFRTLFSDAQWRARVEGVEVDVLLPSIKVAMEVDGERYHATKVRADRAKTHRLEAAGYRVIRLREGSLPALSSTDISFPKGDRQRAAIQATLARVAALVADRRLRSRLMARAKSRDFADEPGYRRLLSEAPMPPREAGLATTHRTLAAQWDRELNSPLTPAHFTAGSNKKVWWKCQFGHAAYQAMIAARASGRGCPYCSGSRAAPDNRVAAYLADLKPRWDYKKNTLDPHKVSRSSIEYAWWNCEVCGHSWRTKIWRVVRSKTGCQVCANRATVLKRLKKKK